MASRERMLSRLNRTFALVTREFSAPFKSHPRVVGAVMGFVLWVNTGVAELSAHNADATLSLAPEMMTKSGPYYAGAMERHVQMLKEYVDHMDARLADLLYGASVEENSSAVPQASVNFDELEHRILDIAGLLLLVAVVVRSLLEQIIRMIQELRQQIRRMRRSPPNT